MSYIKTTWVDNVTPIDKDNLNKIEQGIYDNSLVADAVNNVVKPNDETYKDAEITEGQITDVLAVNDVLIKGNTSQDGEPTPDSPVDINVVSGSNVISTSNKNLFNKKNYSYGYVLSGNAQYTSNNFGTYIKCKPNTTYTVSKILTSRFRLATSEELPTRNNPVECSSIISNERLTHLTITSRSNDNYLIINYHDGGSSYNIDDIVNSLQVEENSTATELVEHQGKELPLDLPVENLLDTIKTSKTINGITYTVNVNGSITLTGTSTRDFNEMIVNPDNVPIINAGTYTKSAKIVGTIIKPTNAHVYLTGYNSDSVNVLGNSELSSNSISFTTTTTADINTMSRIGIYCSTSGVVFDCTIYPMIEKGSKANAYTPYGTTPIELCKIGDYQDYFYRDNGKWYLHKETKKVIFDGSEDWMLREDDGTNYCYSIGNVTDYKHGNLDSYGFSNYFDVGIGLGFHDALLRGIGLRFYRDYGNNVIYLVTNTSTTSSDLKTWLDSNNVVLYYILENSTNTEITDTTLISQLEAIYNAPLYEQTNITQTNNDLPIVLDITACKDNINGIKAWIRK